MEMRRYNRKEDYKERNWFEFLKRECSRERNKDVHKARKKYRERRRMRESKSREGKMEEMCIGG